MYYRHSGAGPEQNLIGMVRDQDLVFYVKHVMHERRHLQQYLEFYQHPTLDYHIEMGKAHIISECCHGYCNHLYWYLPSELDAEIQSFLDTAEYFEQLASLGVVIDVKTLLYKQYTELPQSSVWHGLPQVNTFDDMIQSLRNQKYAYRNMDRGFPFDINFEQDRERLHRLWKYDAWDFVLSASPEDRSTTDYDDKLLAMLLDLNPKLLSKHAGLQEEGKRVTSLYPGEFPTGMAALFKDVVHLLSKDEDGLRL